MPNKTYSFFLPPQRILMGPGPSMVDPRVYLAMAAPTVGYMDAALFAVMDDIQELLRYSFQTANEFTLAITGTGSAGMETAVMNFVEPGTKMAIFANGFFSERMTDMCRRQQADIVRLEKPWGQTYSDDEAREFIERERPQIVGFVHNETSTGALQDPKAICDAAHSVDALVIGDCVTSLGGMPIEIDANGIDIAYSVTQKCLGAPPGLSPMTLSPRAVEALGKRKTPHPSWFHDLKLIWNYWHPPRSYHHTTPVNMMYALREALRIVYEEGLQQRFDRHRCNHLALVAGLEAMGLQMHVEPPHRLWTLNTVRLPAGVNDVALRKALLEGYGIEVLGGFGPLAGQILRIGLMGASSTRNNVLLFLEALETCLAMQGYEAAGSGARAAEAVYNQVVFSGK
jgi:alanine-glyoxylate transaminase/serine-glyoxylate transaminase/serine-pyruvate transaminase